MQDIVKHSFLVVILSIVMNAEAQISVDSQPGKSMPGPPALFKIWGDSAQCEAHRSGKTENPALFPLVITNDWIQQGLVYCYLQWQGQGNTSKGLQAHAFAQCGEDTIREYQLIFNLHENNLSIHWSKDFSNKALVVCD
jgi:hypothetical protein